MITLENNVAIVTGGSKGIGLAIGRGLARKGAKVVLCARNLKGLESSVRSLREEGLMVDGIPADVSDEAEVLGLVESTLQRYGRIDILVNNAGIGVFKQVADTNIAEFDAMWNTNMRGSFIASRAVLPHMTAAKRGEIVFISSLAGKNSIKGGAGYCATKWAMRGFASSLMLEVREHNIRVSTIFPGSVDTAFSAANRRGDQITQPEDVADAVLFAVTAPIRSMFSEIDVRPTNPSRA